MFSRYYKNIIDKFSSPLNDIDILPYFNEDKPLEDEYPYNYDSLSLKEFSSSEDISNDNLNTFSISKMMDNPFEIISEDNDIEKEFNDLFIEIKNKGYAILQRLVVALDFKTLLNKGIPPSNTIFKLCKISAIMTNITKIFSDI